MFLIGRSLGGAVALHLMAEVPGLFRAAVIENTFTSMSDMCDDRYPILKIFPILKTILLKIRWDNLDQIQKVNCPILFIAGDMDTFVPMLMTQRLHAAYIGKKRELWIIKGGNHNNTWEMGQESYVARLRMFIAKHRG